MNDPMTPLAMALADAKTPNDRKALLVQFISLYAAEVVLSDPDFDIEQPLKDFTTISADTKDLTRAILAELMGDPQFKEALVITHLERKTHEQRAQKAD